MYNKINKILLLSPSNKTTRGRKSRLTERDIGRLKAKERNPEILHT